MLFKASELKNLGASRRIYANANDEIRNFAESASRTQNFDIFLSHSYHDKQVILGLKNKLEGYGYSVYIDWINDSALDRSRVTKDHAETLRQRLRQCSCLFFATSEISSQSKWMPWELGFADAHTKGRAAICPISHDDEDTYIGQEYLGIYPYIEEARESQSKKMTLWISASRSKYVLFDSWLTGTDPYIHS